MSFRSHGNCLNGFRNETVKDKSLYTQLDGGSIAIAKTDQSLFLLQLNAASNVDVF
jgi:hypothetical protein